MRDRGNLIGQLRGTVAALLLLVLASYYANITMFYHAHVVDGVTIYHTHFYGGDSKSHAHSSQEFILIKELSHYVVEAPELFAEFTILLPTYRWVYGDVVWCGVDVGCCDHPQLRAPPVA